MSKQQIAHAIIQKLEYMPFTHEITTSLPPPPFVEERCENIDRRGENEHFSIHTMINEHPISEGGYGEFSNEVEKLIDEDRENLAHAVVFFSTGTIKLTENIPTMTRACQQLVADYRHLFIKQEEFKILWNAFTSSIEYHQSLKETIPAPTTAENPSGIRHPEFDLETMAYHSYRHANEMYRDTYKKLTQLQLPESTCKVAATMAFFHDLIQKVDDPFPKPLLGKNEVITTKFLNFIINRSLIDSHIKNALTCLSNATIMGGTFLIKVLTPQGEKRYISLSRQVDDNHITYDPLFKDALDIIKKIRYILAENDVSRTLNEGEFGLTEAMKQNSIIIKLTAALKEHATPEKLADAKNHGVLEENFGAHLISRLFQSIRFLAELSKIPVKEIRDPKLAKIDVCNNIPTSFIDKLRLPITWTVGPFSEMAFAEQNQHTDYVNMLREYSPLLINADPRDIQDLIFLAFTEGQDGNSIDIMKEIGI